MKRFLASAILALALSIGAGVVHAQAPSTCPPETALANDGLCYASVDANGNGSPAGTGVQPTGGNNYNQFNELGPAAQQAANQTPAPPPTASFDTGGVLGQVMSWIASLFAWLLGVAIVALNTSVYYTVVTMGNYVHGLNAVGVSWRILRDVGNIMLIFGFLASGLMIIIGLEDTRYGWGTKMIPKLLIAAVLLNFSLFFAEAIIDTGNLFATQFYAQISGGQIPAPGTLSNTGIADKIMQQLGLTQMYNGVKTNPQLLGKSPLFVGFMGILLFLVTAFVMFSLAFMLVARFVILIILIIVAPVGFAGWAIPKLQNISTKWWGYLLEQTMTAPVLLLLLYVALAVITDKNFLSFGPSPNWNGIFAGDSTSLLGYASVLLSFLVAMGLLLVVLMVAKSMSAVGASWATKTAGNLSFGSVAWAGRIAGGTVLGRGLLNNRFITRGAVSDNKLIRYGSRALSFSGRQLQNRTFDARNLPGVGSSIKMGAETIETGSPATMTAKELQEKQYGLKPVKQYLRESTRGYEERAKNLDREATLASGAPVDIQKELKKMSSDEIAELKGIRAAEDRLVHALTPSAFSELMKNKNLLDSEKSAIRNTWNLQFDTAPSAQAALARMTEDERVALGGETLSKWQVYTNLTADDLDNIRSAKLLPAQKATIAAYVKNIHTGAMPPPPGAPNLQAEIAAQAGNPKFKAYYGL